MKVVILAGGFGSRISEESIFKPKPMIEIGGMPILWHIMKIYSKFGYNDFIICLGYKSFVIKEWFMNYFAYNNDIRVDVQNNKVEILNNETEPWKITLAETGLNTMTGGRIKRIQKYIGNEPFMLTYGDGVADIDINALVRFHQQQGRLLTVTSYKHLERWGLLDIDDHQNVKGFLEKPENTKTFINGGFFVCQPEVFNYLDGDECVFERKPLEEIAKAEQMVAYNHEGFWRCMDTLKDNNDLNELWDKGNAPWKIW